MWIIILEAGVALGLLLFIVWFTLPKNKASDKLLDQQPKVTTTETTDKPEDTHP